MISCRWGYYDDFCNLNKTECYDMLENGIGIIHHVGARKKVEAGTFHDIMISPITDAFNNYEIGTDLEKFLLIPLEEGLKQVEEKSGCSKSFSNFTISMRKFLKKEIGSMRLQI